VGVIQSAREWMNEGAGRWVSILAAVAAVGVAIVVVSRYSGGTDAEEIIAEGQMMLVRCEACGHVERVRLPYGVAFPVECPSCHEVKAVWVQKCSRCGKVFPRPTGKKSYKCPNPDCNAVYYLEDGEP
jgi:ribosomal protein S27E